MSAASGRPHPAAHFALIALVPFALGCERDAPAPGSPPAASAPASPQNATPTLAQPPATAQEAPPSAADSDQAVSADIAALIGQRLPPYPDTLREIAGTCVPDGPELARVCAFSLATLGRPASDGAALVRAVVAARNVDPTADKPTWEVLDAIDAPSAEPDQTLQIGDCRLDGVDALEIVALVRHGEQEWSSDVRWARRFDRIDGQLHDIDPKRVSCHDIGAGV